jgi:cellulose synthase/poly-beta-1,6-N-acetylglucosamine synthase-like glycosyltransferase
MILPLTLSIDIPCLVYDLIAGTPYDKHSRKDYPLQGKEVSVIISSHGDARHIGRLVEEIYSQTYPIKNVYISDSNIDKTGQVIWSLRDKHPNLHYYCTPGVTSKAEKLNRLVRDPRVRLADLVYLKDSTAHAEPDLLEKLVEAFNEPNIAAVTSFGYVAPPKSFDAGLFHYGKEWVNRVSKFRKTAQEARRGVFVVCGASFMVRSDILKSVEIPTGTLTEDTAYTWKLQTLGYKVGARQDTKVWAEDVTSLESELKQSRRWFTGTWQNAYAQGASMFRPGSKGNSLAYLTILPGMIEGTLYAGTLLAMPIIALLGFGADALNVISPQVYSQLMQATHNLINPPLLQHIVEGFFIGDTVLSFASPILAPLLNKEPKEIPKEFWYTLIHYPQIGAYKFMASHLWFASAADATKDVLLGKAKKWNNEWENLG